MLSGWWTDIIHANAPFAICILGLAAPTKLQTPLQKTMFLFGRTKGCRLERNKYETLTATMDGPTLGPPVVPVYPFLGEGSSTKTDYRKKGALVLTSYWRTLNKSDVQLVADAAPASEELVRRLSNARRFSTVQPEAEHRPVFVRPVKLPQNQLLIFLYCFSAFLGSLCFPLTRQTIYLLAGVLVAAFVLGGGGVSTCLIDGGGCPAFMLPRACRSSACSRLSTGGEGTGGGTDAKNTGTCFPACRGQPVFQASRCRPPSPTRHLTSPLSARSTRLRSPICLSDTLPLCRRWFYTPGAWGLLAFERAAFPYAGLCLSCALGTAQERKFC